tara:strand:+ start:5754 stop:6173 length:420 start_codon:yes stop_codon:yes gene_type:complete
MAINFMYDDIAYIAYLHGVSVDMLEDTQFNKNSACSAGDDWVGLGVYEDDELGLISFYHELGHCLDPRRSYPEQPYGCFFEAEAWRCGLELASFAGVNFTPAALGWATEQLKSYYDGKEWHEDPSFFPDARSYAFGSYV